MAKWLCKCRQKLRQFINWHLTMCRVNPITSFIQSVTITSVKLHDIYKWIPVIKAAGSAKDNRDRPWKHEED